MFKQYYASGRNPPKGYGDNWVAVARYRRDRTIVYEGQGLDRTEIMKRVERDLIATFGPPK